MDDGRFTAVDLKANLLYGRAAPSAQVGVPVLRPEASDDEDDSDGDDAAGAADGPVDEGIDADLGDIVGYGCIDMKTKIWEGWECSYRQCEPEKEKPKEWMPRVLKVKAAYQGTQLQQLKMRRSWDDMASSV
jgi:hypothetical protein